MYAATPLANQRCQLVLLPSVFAASKDAERSERRVSSWPSAILMASPATPSRWKLRHRRLPSPPPSVVALEPACLSLVCIGCEGNAKGGNMNRCALCQQPQDDSNFAALVVEYGNEPEPGDEPVSGVPSTPAPDAERADGQAPANSRGAVHGPCGAECSSDCP